MNERPQKKGPERQQRSGPPMQSSSDSILRQASGCGNGELLIHDRTNERNVLGALLLANGDGWQLFGEAQAVVSENDFCDPAYRATWEILHDMHARGDCPLSVSAIIDHAKQHPEFHGLADIGRTLKGCIEAQATPRYTLYYASKLKEASTRQAIQRVASELLARAPDDDLAELVPELQQQARQLAELAAGTVQQRFPGLSCAELDSTAFEQRYLVEGVLPQGQPCLLSGPHKALKTSAALDLALALATGGHWLGYFPVAEPKRVFFMSGESGLACLQATARRIAQRAGICLREVDGLWVEQQLPRIADPGDLQQLAQRLRQGRFDVLILDPCYLAMATDRPEDVFAQGKILRAFSETCADAGVTPILVHHSRKGLAKAYDLPELADAAWSGFSEWARSWLLLGRRKPYEPGSGEHRLWLVLGGSAGHSGAHGLNIDEGAPDNRIWAVERLSLDAAREADRQRTDQTTSRADAVREFLAEHARSWFSRREIREAVHLGDSATRQVLDSLVQAGLVATTETMRRGNACLLYSISSAAE